MNEQRVLYDNQQQGKEKTISNVDSSIKYILQRLNKLDLTAGKSGTSVTSGLGQIVTTLAQIINISVDHEGAADNREITRQLNQLISDRALSDSISVGLDIAQITDMSLLIALSTMGLTVGVVVGTSAHATIGKVSKLMDVKTVRTGHKALNLPGDGGLSSLGLAQVDHTSDILSLLLTATTGLTIGSNSANSVNRHDCNYLNI